MRNLAVFLQWCCMDHFIRKSVLQPMLFPHLCSITQNQQVNVMGLWCLWKKEISCSQKKKKKTNCKALYTITTIDLQFSFHCTTVSAQHVFQVALNSQYSQSFCFKLHLSPPPPPSGRYLIVVQGKTENFALLSPTFLYSHLF